MYKVRLNFGSQHNMLGTCRVGLDEVAEPIDLPGLVDHGVFHPFFRPLVVRYQHEHRHQH